MYSPDYNRRGFGKPRVVTNQSHTLAYSLVALQEMNLAYRFPLIYWNTACLITDTGGAEDLDGDKSNNYDKITT